MEDSMTWLNWLAIAAIGLIVLCSEGIIDRIVG